MTQLFSGVTNQYNATPDRLAMPFHWNVTVEAGGTFDEYAELLKKPIQGPKTIYVHPYITEVENTFPPTKIPRWLVKETWLLRYGNGTPVTWTDRPYCYYIDIRIPEARAACVQWMVTIASAYKRNMLCVDNLVYKTLPTITFPVTAKDWTAAQLLMLQEIRATRMEFVINCACSVDLIPESLRVFGRLANGYMTENPFHPNLTAKQHDQELLAYKLYAMAFPVYLMPKTAERYAEVETHVEGLKNIFVCARKD
jgi:hypothetical protein